MALSLIGDDGKPLETAAELDAKIQAAKLTDDQAQQVRIAHQHAVFAANRRLSQSQYPNVSKLGSLVSAGMNFGNQAIPNVASAGAAVLTAPFTAARRDIGLGDAFELNRDKAKMVLGASPTSQAVGEIAAVFAPTPYNKLLGKAFDVGSRRLALLATEGNIAKRAIAQLGAQFAGSSAVIGASEAAKGVFDERSLSEIASDTIANVVSPTNLALSGGMAGLSTAFRAAPKKDVLALVDRARRILPDFKASPDMLREEGGFIAGLVNSLAWSPYGRRTATEFLRKSVYKPISDALDTMRGRTGATGTYGEMTEKAGGALKGLLPSPESKGRIGKAIQTAGRKGFQEAEAAGDHVSVDTMKLIAGTLGRLNQRAHEARGSEGPRGAEMERIARNIESFFIDAAAGRAKVTPQHLDNLRQSLAPLAGFDASGMRGRINEVLSQRDTRDAKTLYRVMRIAEAKSSRSVDRALTEIKELRDLWRTFQPIANVAATESSAKTASAFFSASNFESRWKSAQKVMRADEIQAMRGVYLADLIERTSLVRGNATNPDRLVGFAALQKLMHGTGPYQESKARMVLGNETVNELLEIGRISNLVTRSIGKAEGSRTARSLQDLDLLNAGMEVASDVATLVKDPSVGITKHLLQNTLGRTGIYWFANSLINGRIANGLNRLASGRPVTGPRVLPAALANLGGASGAANTAADALSALVSGGGRPPQ